MKVAVCLFGHVGSYTGSIVDPNFKDRIDLKIAFNNYTKKIFRNYDTDIFIHSWSYEEKDFFIEKYKPKKFIFEKQINFSNITIDSYSFYKNRPFDDGTDIHSVENFDATNLTIYQSQSRWYSNTSSLRLMSEYAMENNVKYDWVIQCRLDLNFFTKIDLKKLDSNIFYHPVRPNEANIAINEFFFISNFDYAKKFIQIKDNLFNFSIRPPVAAKQFLNLNKINHKGYLEYGVDFYLIREYLYEQKLKNKYLIRIKLLIKKIIRLFK